MRKFFSTAKILCLLLCLLLCDTAVSSAEAKSISSELIRLHVVAKEDTPEATAHKEAVRDALLQTFFTDTADNIAEQRAYISDHLEEIGALAVKTLEDRGEKAEVTVTFGDRRLPEKEYAGFTLPEGVYETLTVTVGEGKGSNWWCVLFPPLCMAPAQQTEETARSHGMSDDCFATITRGGTRIRLHSKVVGTVKKLAKRLTK